MLDPKTALQQLAERGLSLPPEASLSSPDVVEWYAKQMLAALPSDPELVRIPVPDGELRIWAPEVHANDLGRMYVLDVFGKTILIREREDGVYIHLDHDGESKPTEHNPTLIYEVSNGGENEATE